MKKSLNQIYITKNNGLFGLTDEDRRIISEPVYEDIRPFPNGIHAVKKSGRWGYINHDGDVIIDFQFYDAKSFSDNLVAPVQFSKKPTRWGIIDIEGHEIEISKKRNFADITNFNEHGIAIGTFFGKKYIIDEKGKVVNDKIYYDIAYDENLNLLVAREIGKLAVIDRSGNLIVNPDESYDDIYYKSDGMYQVTKESKGGYINEQGELVIGFEFDRNFAFSEGLAYVQNGEIGGFIDKSGKYVIPPKFPDASHFECGLAPVMLEDEYYYYIDRCGKIAFDQKFEFAESFQKNKIAKVMLLDGTCAFIKTDGSIAFEYDCDYDISYFERDDITTFKCDEKMGIIDSSGNIKVPPVYDKILISPEYPLHAFCDNGKWGYIDQDAHIVIPAIYDKAFAFSKFGYSVVQDEENIFEYKVIDSKNTTLVQFPLKNINIDSFKEDIITIQYFVDGLEKYNAFKLDFSKIGCDGENEFLKDVLFNSPFDKYEWISPFYEGEAIVQILSKPIHLGLDGKELNWFLTK